jgi:hypothetical protein
MCPLREPTVNPVGEPDAGNPHVRFDERRRETEPWRGLRHPRGGESRGLTATPHDLPPPRPSSTLPSRHAALRHPGRMATRRPPDHALGLAICRCPIRVAIADTQALRLARGGLLIMGDPMGARTLPRTGPRESGSGVDERDAQGILCRIEGALEELVVGRQGRDDLQQLRLHVPQPGVFPGRYRLQATA